MSDEVTRFDMSIEWGSMCGCDIVYVSDGDYVRYADYAALRAQLTTAERERDEAREQLRLANIDWANCAAAAADHRAEADALRHRAERAERVVEAARKWVSTEAGEDFTEWKEMRDALRALDAEAQP